MKKVNKNKPGRPPEYPYANMSVSQVVIMLYDTEQELVKSHVAAHQIAHSHKWKFKGKSRKTDAGRFELTVNRVV